MISFYKLFYIRRLLKKLLLALAGYSPSTEEARAGLNYHPVRAKITSIFTKITTVAF